MGGTDTYFTMKDGTISDNTSTGYGGGGVYVNGGTFTMEKGMISGNKATGNNNNGGGVSNSGSGTFEMNGGKIQGNEAAYYAGVRVDGGSFTMKAGEISGNKANQSIGGVYVYSATFTMSGGKIVDNTASETCGGVRVLSSTFNLSGEVDISSNKAGNADKNVVLSDGQIITIQGELKNANPIGVSFSSALTGDTVFTSDYGSKMSNADPAKYFKSEQDGYGVFKNETSNEAMLAKIAIETGFKDETIDIEGVKYTGKEIKP